MGLPNWVDQVPPDAVVDLQPKVMRRVHLYSGDAIEVRLHLFDDPAETLIHNHGTNFFSSCLTGRYEHTVWCVTDDPKTCHFRFNRTKDPELGHSERAPGNLEAGLVHTHQSGRTYFISASIAHTVKPVFDQTSREPVKVMTMYIRSGPKKRDTIMLSPEKEPDWGGKNAREQKLEGSERQETLQEISSIVNHGL